MANQWGQVPFQRHGPQQLGNQQMARVAHTHGQSHLAATFGRVRSEVDPVSSPPDESVRIVTETKLRWAHSLARCAHRGPFAQATAVCGERLLRAESAPIGRSLQGWGGTNRSLGMAPGFACAKPRARRIQLPACSGSGFPNLGGRRATRAVCALAAAPPIRGR